MTYKNISRKISEIKNELPVDKLSENEISEDKTIFYYSFEGDWDNKKWLQGIFKYYIDDSNKISEKINKYETIIKEKLQTQEQLKTLKSIPFQREREREKERIFNIHLIGQKLPDLEKQIEQFKPVEAKIDNGKIFF